MSASTPQSTEPAGGRGRPQVPPAHYRGRSYDFKGRFISYWHQVDEVLRQQPASVLEVGIGNGFVSRYLRERGVALTTLDHDPGLEPDITAALPELPFADRAFDVVACFEVLEHLPAAEVAVALGELRRVTRTRLLLSVPDASRVYPLLLHLPGLRPVKALLSLPRLWPPVHRFDGEHHWELGKRGHGLRWLRAQVRAAGLVELRSFRPFEIPYHRFFELAPR